MIDGSSPTETRYARRRRVEGRTFGDPKVLPLWATGRHWQVASRTTVTLLVLLTDVATIFIDSSKISLKALDEL